MNKALLDTDIDSEILKAVNPTVVQNAAVYRQAHGFLTISVITVMEIVQGLQRVQGASRIQKFRNSVAAEEILLFDQDTADLAGQIAGDLDRVGRPIGRCDPMVAAVAIRHGLELITGNTAHYQYLAPSRLFPDARKLACVIQLKRQRRMNPSGHCSPPGRRRRQAIVPPDIPVGHPDYRSVA